MCNSQLSVGAACEFSMCATRGRKMVPRGGSRTTWWIKELAFPTRENRTAERSRTYAGIPNPAAPQWMVAEGSSDSGG